MDATLEFIFPKLYDADGLLRRMDQNRQWDERPTPPESIIYTWRRVEILRLPIPEDLDLEIKKRQPNFNSRGKSLFLIPTGTLSEWQRLANYSDCDETEPYIESFIRTHLRCNDKWIAIFRRESDFIDEVHACNAQECVTTLRENLKSLASVKGLWLHSS